MWSSDFKARAQNLEREQKQRLARDRLRAEKERAEKERQRQRVQQHEQEAGRRRAAALAAADIERKQHEDEIEYNRGVWWEAKLSPRLIESQDASAKGIKRGSDKIQLPASVSGELMGQDAPKNGTMFFQIQTLGGRSTHAGVLDFSAGAGIVGLPRLVVASLWPSGDIPPEAIVTVTYRRLEKGTYTRLQPETADFQKNVSDSMEDTLVSALQKRSALSEGDWITVDVEDTAYRLRVQQLKPRPQVSVIDTDMEAEVEPSIETEDRLRQEAEEAEQRKAELDRLAQDAIRKQQAAEKAAQEQAAEKEKIRKEKEATLPAEPDPGSGCTTCLFRFPDGNRHTRRFRSEDPLALLFQFVDAKGAGGHLPGNYRLVTQYPRQELDNTSEGSLSQAGIGGRQQALMLEPINGRQ